MHVKQDELKKQLLYSIDSVRKKLIDLSIIFSKGLDSSRQVKSLKKTTKLLSLQNMFRQTNLKALLFSLN